LFPFEDEAAGAAAATGAFVAVTTGLLFFFFFLFPLAAAFIWDSAISCARTSAEGIANIEL
jgi:hypothetical protein